MGLQLWMPLTKDLRQQGLSGITPTQTTGYTSVAAGKLGGCYKFTGTFDTLLPLSNWNWTEGSVSFGCWAKISQSELATLVNAASYDATYNSMGGTLLGRDSYGGLGLRWKTNNIYSSSTLSAVYIYVHMRNTSSSANYTSNYTIPFDTWFHVMSIIDRNENKIKVYINGELFTSTNLTVTGSFNTGTFRIAEATWDGGNGRSSAGCWQLNDVRVYNHALSQMEVKELAKGLVLHYPLSNIASEGTTNLITSITAGGQTSVSNGVITTSGTNADTYFTLNLSESITSGTQYTISCYAEIPSGASWNFPLGTQSNSSLPFVIYNGYNEYTFIANDISWGTNRCFMDDGNGATNTARSLGVTTKMWNFQLEKKDHATPFVGYGVTKAADTTEYDCSGFCNNGTRTGTFTWISDTPKYAVSTQFGSTSTKIQLPVMDFSGMANSYTFAWWQYNVSTGNMPWGFSNGNRLNCYHTSPLCWNTGDGSSNQFKNGSTTIAPASVQNAWHHMVITGDGTSTKLYIDGVYRGTATTYKALTGTQIWISGWDSGTSYTFNGSKECDFRIYATAISAEDVKSLYQNSAYIDSSGNIYGTIHEV